MTERPEAASAGSWPTISLGDAAEITSGPAFQSSRFTEDADDVPLLRGMNVGVGATNWSSTKRWPRSEYDKYKRYALGAGDVILAMDRPWITDGLKLLVLGATDLPALLVQRVARIRASRNVDQRFLSGVLRSEPFAEYLKAVTTGTAVPHISGGDIADFQFLLPPIDSQRRIGCFVRALDELIEINERRIEVLEDLARSLYREWFVRLRFPGSEKVGLVDSELGPIPEGWGVGTLGGIARWYSGGTPSTKNPDYWDGSIPWITSGSLTSMLLDSSERRLTDEGVRAGSRLVDRDTVLFVVRGMSLVREFRVGLADCSLAFGQDCKALVANAGTDPLFLAFTIFDKQSDIQAMVELAGHGTGKLSTDRVKAVAFPLPPEQIQLEFASAIRPIRELMSTLVAQTRRHRGLRDLVLPRLVTGQLDISDIDLGVLTPPEAA